MAKKGLLSILIKYGKETTKAFIYGKDKARARKALSKAISDIQKWHEEQCKNCKEEKLNMVAKRFKKYNKIQKLMLSEKKIIESIATDEIFSCISGICRGKAGYNEDKLFGLIAKALHTAQQRKIDG